jgi:hypothetical protein
MSTKPLFIIPATTPAYQSYAQRMIQSARDCGWDANFLVLEEPDNFRGRFVKTTFAKYIPLSHTSQVILLDADTLATGPLDIPKVEGDVAAVQLLASSPHITKYFRSRHPKGHIFDTFILVFPDIKAAHKVSECWHASWLSKTGMDMPAFNNSTHLFECDTLPYGGSRKQPTPYLQHLVK